MEMNKREEAAFFSDRAARKSREKADDGFEKKMDEIRENSKSRLFNCDVEGCEEKVVTFHGVMFVTHGYCEKHRCCYKCGLRINKMPEDGPDDVCKCKTPRERPEYLELLELRK